MLTNILLIIGKDTGYYELIQTWDSTTRSLADASGVPLRNINYDRAQGQFKEVYIL